MFSGCRKSSSISVGTTNTNASVGGGDANNIPTNPASNQHDNDDRKDDEKTKKTTKKKAIKRKRLMRSSGHNVIFNGVPGRTRKYFSDLYTTLVDIQWRWNICIFLGGFIVSWMVFACFYYFQMYLHGDFDDVKVSPTPCLENVQSFTAAYLFSIETMSTIGYGSRSQTTECPGVYFAVLIQSILGAGLQFALASIVVSKTKRAKRRSGTVLFSNRVCICEQDGRLQLTARVGDMRKSEIIGAHAKGFLIKKLRSRDGTMVPIRSFTLEFKSQSGRSEIFFPWPTQLVHTIDEESPLWSLSRDAFQSGQYELIVIIDGICGSTSNSFQARKSYHVNEMKWGFRFMTLGVSYIGNTYVMDLSAFHHTVPASTPLCSAQDINSLRILYQTNHPECRDSQTTTHSIASTNQNNDINTNNNNNNTLNNVFSGCNSNENSINSSNNDLRLYGKRTSSSRATLSNLPRRSVASNSYSNSLELTVVDPRLEAHRSRSMEERPLESDMTVKAEQNMRRCSLGDMIRLTRGKDQHSDSSLYDDAMNNYRHRKSVTDTYLGADCEDDDPDDISYKAILSVMSQRSAERRTDVRDVFRKRRNSVSQLYLGRESNSSDEDGVSHARTQSCSYRKRGKVKCPVSTSPSVQNM